MVDPTLLQNLAETQSFDAVVREGLDVDRIASRFLKTVLFQPNHDKRKASIGELQGELVSHFAKQVQPAARRLGTSNARRVLAVIPAELRNEGLASEAVRRRALVDGKYRADTRLRIVQALVNDKANTLDNRLLAYWLEPGRDAQEKLDRLRELHEQMAARQVAYARALSDFHQGRLTTRPRKPNLDYMARLQSDVKQVYREQARREGTEAETQHFVAQGHAVLTWVTVNAGDACLDCRNLNAATKPIGEWDKVGRPGAGHTVCKEACFCMLVPQNVVRANPRLAVEGLRQPDPVPPEPAPEFPPTSELANLKEVRGLGGSTGARLVEDRHGQRFVLKRGASADHLREEFAAEQAYRALGVAVPEARLYEQDGGPLKLSKFIDGTPLGKLEGEARAAAERKVRDGFAADALMANWDAIGTGKDNILVDAAGQAYRVDVGGSLRYRAQGAAKGDAFGRYPVELWSLQEKQFKDNADVFAPVTFTEKVQQIERLAAKREPLMRALPEDLRAVVGQRLDEMQRVAATGRTMLADQWKPEYLDAFTRDKVHIRAAGIIDALPKRLTRTEPKGYIVKDENGKQWDDLRGPGSAVTKLATYIDRSGGSYKMWGKYMSEQAGTSWATHPKAAKEFFARQRDVPGEAYFWENGRAQSQRSYETVIGKRGKEKWGRTLTAWHAYMHEFLGAVDLEHNDRAAGMIRLYRTETKSLINGTYGLKRGDLNVTMPRGAMESTSLYTKVDVKGSELTVQQVPHHRVLTVYFHERTPSVGDKLLYGDHENEALAMLEGVRFDYKKPDGL